MSFDTRSKRLLYSASALVIAAPVYFTWTGLNPVFPPALSQQDIGPFTATPTPADTLQPYARGSRHYKDFSLVFCEGCTDKIRTAHLNIGPAPLENPADDTGILHGSRFLQHVHAPAPHRINQEDRIWLSVQDWHGQRWYASWPAAPTLKP